MSSTPYADIGFCLECATQHARDTEHHLEDAVKFSKGDPKRDTFQELLDSQRLVRKGVDKLRIQQIQETGEETCIACGNAIEETLNSGEAKESVLAIYPDIDEAHEIKLTVKGEKQPYQIFYKIVGVWNTHRGPIDEEEMYRRIWEGMRAFVNVSYKSSGNPGNPEIPEHCEFAKEEVKPKEYFDPQSFRTLCPESPTRLCKDLPPELACATRIIIGCREGEFIEGRCRVGTEAHVIYHGTPKPSLSNPHLVNPDQAQITPELERIRRLHTQAIPDDPGKTVNPRTGQQFERFWLPDSLKEELIAEFKRPEGQKTGIAAIKYFNPAGVGTWWISEYDPEWDAFFGIAKIHVAEYGYISRKELRETRLRMGLWIERDYYWTPKPLTEIMREQGGWSSAQSDKKRIRNMLSFGEALEFHTMLKEGLKLSDIEIDQFLQTILAER